MTKAMVNIPSELMATQNLSTMNVMILGENGRPTLKATVRNKDISSDFLRPILEPNVVQ